MRPPQVVHSRTAEFGAMVDLLAGYVQTPDPDPELTADIAREVARFWEQER